MTPYELMLHVDEHNKKSKVESDNLIIQAWLTAYWQRVPKMPDLMKLIGQDKPKEEQTPEQMLEAIKKLNAAMGGDTV